MNKRKTAMNPEYNNDPQSTPPQQPNSQYTIPGNPQPGAAPGGSPQSYPSSTGNPGSKNTKMLLWVSIVVAVLVVIGVVFFFMKNSNDKKDDSSNKTTNSSSNSSNSGSGNNDNTSTSGNFQKYDVEDSLGNYSVSFYKNAKILPKNGLQYLIAGDSGSQISVFLTLGEGSEMDCEGSPSTTMKVAGQTAKVCYQEDGTIYAGQVAVKGVATRVNVAGQAKLNLEDVKAIMASVSFK
jgi:hypothetical protein